jgi:hypothetical protein
MTTPFHSAPSLEPVRAHAAANEDGMIGRLTDWCLYQQRRIDEQASLIMQLSNKVARLESQLGNVFAPSPAPSATYSFNDDDPFASDF